MQQSRPDHVSALAALWPYVRTERVGAAEPVARLLPAARGRCGVYVLTFADGRLRAGQTGNVVARFAAHRKAYDDLVEMHFWRFARAGLDSAEQTAIDVLRQSGFVLRDVPGELGDLVGAAELDRWLASAPADEPDDDVRPQRPRGPVRGEIDPRAAALLPAVRRYLARTVPAPRRTELSRWTVSGAGPRLLTVSVHAMETLFAAAEPGRTLVTVNLDQATIERFQGALDRFGAAHHRTVTYRVRPGVIAVTVEGARNLMRLLDVPGVVEAARRLNLDLMRKGPALQRRTHAPDLADLLLEPAAETATGEAFADALACDAAGDIPRAEQLYRLAGTPEAAFRLGELWAERGDSDQAEPWYRQAGAGGFHGVRRPSAAASVHALTARGRDAAAQGNRVAAAQWFRRAAAAGSTASYLDLGRVLADLGDTEQAVVAYRCAAGSGHPAGWHALGVLHEQAGDLDAAEDCFRRAVDAGHAAGWTALGLLRRTRGDLAEAEACLRTAAAERHTGAHLHLGDLLAERGDADGAEQQYRLAARAGDQRSITRLGRLFLDLDDLDAAEPLLRAAATDDPQAMYLLSILLARRHQSAEADGWLHRAADAGHEQALAAAG